MILRLHSFFSGWSALSGLPGLKLCQEQRESFRMILSKDDQNFIQALNLTLLGYIYLVNMHVQISHIPVHGWLFKFSPLDEKFEMSNAIQLLMLARPIVDSPWNKRPIWLLWVKRGQKILLLALFCYDLTILTQSYMCRLGELCPCSFVLHITSTSSPVLVTIQCK